MELFFLICGFFLILTGLLDLYFSLIHYEVYGAISMSLHKLVWFCIRVTANRFGGALKRFILTQGAPLMIVVLLCFWLGIELFGFSFVYYGGLQYDGLLYSSFNRKDFSDVLFTSGMILTTLGSGNITPVHVIFKLLIISESIIGFAILTLSLTFVLNIYKAIQQFRTLAATLHNETGGSGDVWDIIKRQAADRHFSIDTFYIRDLHTRLVQWYESLHQFPIAYYFYSPRSFLSIPYAFRLIGELICVLRYSLPVNTISENLSIFSLLHAYQAVINNLLKKYFPHSTSPHIHILPYEKFLQTISYNTAPDKQFMEFNRICNTMAQISGIRSSGDLKEMYSRYIDWLQLTTLISHFVESTTQDHGYSRAEIYQPDVTSL